MQSEHQSWSKNCTSSSDYSHLRPSKNRRYCCFDCPSAYDDADRTTVQWWVHWNDFQNGRLFAVVETTKACTLNPIEAYNPMHKHIQSGRKIRWQDDCPTASVGEHITAVPKLYPQALRRVETEQTAVEIETRQEPMKIEEHEHRARCWAMQSAVYRMGLESEQWPAIQC